MSEQQIRLNYFPSRAAGSVFFATIFLAAFLPLAALGAGGVVGKDVDVFGQPLEYEPQPEDKWQESTATIPAYPREDDLLRVKLPERFTIELFVDATTVEVGKDGVARMTVVVKPKGGAVNVFYEGFRCATVEHKTYAFGTSDKKLKAISKPTWQTLPYPEANNYLRRLFHDYICADDVSSRQASRILSNLRATTFPTDPWFNIDN